jgi:hypothetical protein
MSIEDRCEETSPRVPEGSEVQTEDRSPMSEDFGPQWEMTEFYSSIESKSVYEAEDMVLERLGDADNDASSEALKHLPYRTTLGLGTRPLLRQGLSSVGSNHPVFERTLACPKRFGEPLDYSGDGIPFYGVNVARDGWHVQAAEVRGIALAAKPPALPTFSKEQIKSVKEYPSWETDPALVEDVADPYKRHQLEFMYSVEPEVVNF